MKSSTPVNALSLINETLEDNNPILSNYLTKIKQYSVNDKKYKNKIEKLYNDLEHNMEIPDELKPFKNVIHNVIKSLGIMIIKNDMEEEVSSKLVDQILLKNEIIKALQDHIKTQNKLLEDNNIEVPEFKSLALNSTVKTDEAYSKRFEVLQNGLNDEKSKINEWLSKQTSIIKSKRIPNDILEEESKRQGINIKTNKNEINKVIKRPEH